MELTPEAFEGWLYLGSNNHMCENPRKLREMTKAINNNELVYGDETNPIFKLNERWFARFGYGRSFPNFITECICGKEKLKYNHYFCKGDEVVCIGSGCADKVREINKAKYGYKYDKKLCVRCGEPHRRKGKVCTKCSGSVFRVRWCHTCNEFVFDERVKRECSKCIGGIKYIKHPCYKGNVYIIKCVHNVQTCDKCDTKYLLTHVCGDGTLCEKCDTTFNYKHKCFVNSYLCKKCNMNIVWHDIKINCTRCNKGYDMLPHTCYGESRLEEPQLCVCTRRCKRCFIIHTADETCYYDFLIQVRDKGKHKGRSHAWILINDVRYFSYLRLDYNLKYVVEKIRDLLENGDITNEALLAPAQSIIY